MMSGDAVIALAERNKTTPGLIFIISSFSVSADTILSILEGRGGTINELIEAVTRYKDSHLELELEIEAFKYWVEVNSDLIKKWESLESGDSQFITWETVKSINEKVLSRFQSEKQILEKLGNTRVRFG